MALRYRRLGENYRPPNVRRHRSFSTRLWHDGRVSVCRRRLRLFANDFAEPVFHFTTTSLIIRANWYLPVPIQFLRLSCAYATRRSPGASVPNCLMLTGRKGCYALAFKSRFGIVGPRRYASCHSSRGTSPFRRSRIPRKRLAGIFLLGCPCCRSRQRQNMIKSKPITAPNK